MRNAKAIGIEVYRSRSLGDCTNHGISSKYDELLLLCDDGYIDVDLDDPPENLVKIVHRKLFGQDIYHVQPVIGSGYMSGGNYAASSDARFCDMCGRLYGALSIHDRQEN